MHHAAAVARLLVRRGDTVATAESCTGGLLAAQLTDLPGSSEFMQGGVVAYTAGAKRGLLGVPAGLLARAGAVSAEVAAAMATGIRRRLGADWAVGVTGVAGPTGGTAATPIGLVFIAVAGPRGCAVRPFRLGRTRHGIRQAAVRQGLAMLEAAIAASPGAHRRAAKN